MKFGGTSMAGIERIRHVAGLVKREAERGNDVAVVVSAMAGETDRLVQLCKEAAPLYDPREYDVVVASGEQVTSGLLAITLSGMGLDARSYMGWQLPIRASGHTPALIDHIDADVLEAVFARRGIAVIPGFQGVTAEGDLATLGRGGSDTSAVALAVAVKADRCDIYTDVEGVYTTDPRIVPRARKLGAITYEEMLELASVGAKVLQTRSVGLAMRYNMALQVLSSFEDKPGTLIVGDDEDRGPTWNAAHHRHRPRQERGADHADRPARPAGHRGRHLRSARRGEHQRRHDRPERPRHGAAERSHLHRPDSLARPCRRRARKGARGDPVRRNPDRHQCRESQRGRHRHALQRGHRRQDVRDAGRARDQHPCHLDIGDQGLGAGRARNIPSSRFACFTARSVSTRTRQDA